MYDVTIYTNDKNMHYVKLSEVSLDNFRDCLEDEVAVKYVEVYCEDNESTFAVNREKIVAFEYKEQSDE